MRISGKAKKLRVSLQMSRYNTGVFGFRISDENSGLTILETELTAEDFADLLSTRTAFTDANFYSNENIGKKLEVKHITIKLEKENWNYKKVELQEKVVEWEKENPGWVVDKYEIENWNSHNVCKDGYRVIARRYVCQIGTIK